MWDNIFAFAVPDDDYEKFYSSKDEYFLGHIVTFRNDNGKLEVIDGQQRLTTLMLLLRAFYSMSDNVKDALVEWAKDRLRNFCEFFSDI